MWTTKFCGAFQPTRTLGMFTSVGPMTSSCVGYCLESLEACWIVRFLSVISPLPSKQRFNISNLNDRCFLCWGLYPSSDQDQGLVIDQYESLNIAFTK